MALPILRVWVIISTLMEQRSLLMIDDLNFTVLEINDEEYQIIHMALERLRRQNIENTPFGSVSGVLYLLEEAFATTEDYRRAEDPSYVLLDHRLRKELDELSVPETIQ